MFTHYYRHPGLTKSTEENILRKLQTKVDPAIAAVDTELCYNLDMITDFTKDSANTPSCGRQTPPIFSWRSVRV